MLLLKYVFSLVGFYAFYLNHNHYAYTSKINIINIHKNNLGKEKLTYKTILGPA